MQRITLFTLLAVLSCPSAFADRTLHLQVSSPVAHDAAPVVIPMKNYGDVRSAHAKCDGKEIAVQLDDVDGDGHNDQLALVLPIKAQQTKNIELTLSNKEAATIFPPATFAEIVLRNPSIKEKNKHDIYLQSITLDRATRDPYHVLHHHGVAFENEMVAMRVYMDKRGTIDLYGKRHKGLELKDTQFYPSQEQKANGYGDDVLWVGNTFGLGAFRGWDGTAPTMLDDVTSRTQRIVAQGPVRVIVEMETKGWRMAPNVSPVDVTVRYTLYKGHRDVTADVSFSRDVSAYTFSTGLVNVKNSTEFSDHKGLRGCWGTAYPDADTIHWQRETVGLGILMDKGLDFKEQATTKDNYPFTFRTKQHARYHLCYTSDKEDYGYHDAASWFAFLKQWRREVENPVVVKIK